MKALQAVLLTINLMVIELAPHKLYFHNLHAASKTVEKVDITTKRILKDALLEYTEVC